MTDYTYNDPGGRRTAMTDAEGSHSYTYDDGGMSAVQISGCQHLRGARDEAWPRFLDEVWPSLWRAVALGSPVYLARCAEREWSGWVTSEMAEAASGAPIVAWPDVQAEELKAICLHGSPLGAYIGFGGSKPELEPVTRLYPSKRWRVWRDDELRALYGTAKVTAFIHVSALGIAPEWLAIGYDGLWVYTARG